MFPRSQNKRFSHLMTDRQSFNEIFKRIIADDIRMIITCHTRTLMVNAIVSSGRSFSERKKL